MMSRSKQESGAGAAGVGALGWAAAGVLLPPSTMAGGRTSGQGPLGEAMQQLTI
jgi:hypothetical protein